MKKLKEKTKPIKIRVLGSSYYYESRNNKLLRNIKTGEIRESWLVGLDKPVELEEVDNYVLVVNKEE